MKELIGLTESLTERVFRLHAKFHKAADIQKIISEETKQDVPIETIRDLIRNPRYLAQRRIERDRYNDELQDEPLASKRYRLRLCNDLMEQVEKDEFTDPKDLYDLKIKIITLAGKIMEDKNKNKDDTPQEINTMINKVHPFYQQQYIEGKIDLKKIIELVKTGKAYAMPDRNNS